MAVSALDRKLLRDLWAMRTQALAIALVVAAGVAMWVMFLSNHASLERSREAFYEAQRFADVFASLKRAPESMAARIAAIAGVAHVETRVVADVVLDVPGLREPASARLVSLPAARRPALNDVHLRAGRWLDPQRPDEVLASEAFVSAHGLRPGDGVAAVINGRKRELRIAGVVLSPEYVYAIRPGELVPDDRLYGVFWMDRRALAAAFDMEGGFNDVALRLSAPSAEAEVIARLDRLLERYGGIGAVPRALQPSHWMLDAELGQIRSFGVAIPLIFLLVAAFVLNVALARTLAMQRPQLAALKALGYTNAELAWHYLKWALAIAGLGAAIGLAAGAWLGAGMSDLYATYFRFPDLRHTLSPALAVGASAVALVAAALGAFTSVRRATRIPAAEAMRAQPPARFRRSWIETRGPGRHLATATRMMLRNLERQPWRALVSVFGIGCAGAILIIGFSSVASVEQLIRLQFQEVERQDMLVNLFEPSSARTRHALARLPGVLAVEPLRQVPVRIVAGHRHRDLAVTGLPHDARMRRVVGRDGRIVALPHEGVVLSAKLAQLLGVSVGDEVTLEVREGARPAHRVRVAGLVDDSMGLAAYMDARPLHRLLREGGTLTGAALRVDAAHERALSQRLKELPTVAGVAIKSAMLASFRKTMQESLGFTIAMIVAFACVIAFGVIYNAARISLSERSRELASLRVLGFTRAEISLILLGELAVLTLLALPAGLVIARLLILAMGPMLETEIYRFALVVDTRVAATAALVVIAAVTVSGLIVRRQLDRLDLVAVLKIQE